MLANDRISLTVRRGEVHCLLGENGAGKSTLMNILSGMMRPDAGKVRLDGREVEIHSPKHAIELGIGMVYQHTSLVPQLTVLENLMLGEGEGIRLNAAAARGAAAELGGSIGLDVDPGATTGHSHSASSSSSRSSRRSGAARRCSSSTSRRRC